MKNFTLLLVGLFSFLATANAEVKEEKLTFGGNTWNVNIPVNSNITLIGTSQWAEYKLTGTSFSVADYKGFRVEYTDLTVAGAWQIKIENASGGSQYLDLVVGQTSLEGTFNTETFATDQTITTFNIQAKETNASVTVVKAVLIKNDDTEEQLTFAGSAWGGLDISPSTFAAPTLIFTGQYGGQQLYDPSGAACVYTPSETEKQAYVVEFEEPVPAGMLIELDGAGGGFAWMNFDAGITSYSFTLDQTVAQAVTSIWLKYGGTDAPVTVKIKSAMRVVYTGDDATAIEKTLAVDNATVTGTLYYTTGGQEVSAPVKGVNILRQTLSNGKTISKKILIK